VSESSPSPTPVPAPRSRTVTREAWAERLQRFAASGLSPAQFCAQEGVSLPSFYSWKRRLAADAQATNPAVPPAPDWLPVRLPSPSPVLELTLPSGVSLRIPPGTDEATLRALLRLLGVTPC
jgi:transposase